MDSCSTPLSTRQHRVLPVPCRKGDSKIFIINTLRGNPSIKTSEIAQMADCSADHVRKILKAHQANAHEPQKWFERAVEADPAGLRATLEQVLLEGEKPRLPSTNLLNPLRVHLTTDRELEAKTFDCDLNSTDHAEIKRSREWLRIGSYKEGGQGFVIMDAHSDLAFPPQKGLFDEILSTCQRFSTSRVMPRSSRP